MIFCLRKIDMFPKVFNFHINRQPTLSTCEGICFSLIFYLIAIIIIIYNFAQVYSNDNPILKSQELIRDLKKYDKIPSSAFSLTFGLYNFDSTTFSLDALEYNNETVYKNTLTIYKTFIQYLPKFIYKREAVATLSECFGKVKETGSLIANAQCYNFTDDTVEIGGSAFSSSNETYLENNERAPGLDICNFNSVYNSGEALIKYPNLTIEQVIDKTTPSSICKNGKTPSTIVFNLLYSSDLIDINSYKGYSTHILNAYKNFDFHSKILNIEVLLTKSIIETDRNKLYNIKSPDISEFYEKQIVFNLVEKEKADDKLNIRILYNYNVKIKHTDRSYNKIDSVLAACFSLIDIILFILNFIVTQATKRSIEYEIINNLYYSTVKDEFDLKRLRTGKTFNIKATNNTVYTKNNLNRNSDYDVLGNSNISSTQNPNAPPDSNRNNLLDKKVEVMEEVQEYVVQDKLYNSNIPNNPLINNFQEIAIPKIAVKDRKKEDNTNIILSDNNKGVLKKINNLKQISINKNYSNINIIINNDKESNINEIAHQVSTPNKTIPEGSKYENSFSSESGSSSIEIPKNKDDNELFSTIKQAKRLDYHSGMVHCFKDIFRCFHKKKQEKQMISRRKAVEVVNREIDILVVLKKLIELEFLTHKFYLDSFGDKTKKKRASYVYDHAFFYTNRNVDAAEDIFFTMDYKYFGSSLALFRQLERKQKDAI